MADEFQAAGFRVEVSTGGSTAGNDEPGASTDQGPDGQDHDNDEDDEDEDGDSDDSDDSTRPPSPRVRDEEEDGQDDQPREAVLEVPSHPCRQDSGFKHPAKGINQI